MITVQSASYGIEVKVQDGQDTWIFGIDLYHLASGEDRAVQVVVHDPKNLEGDPLQHIRVTPEGKLTFFDA